MTKNVNPTQRRMLTEMRQLLKRIDGYNARMDAIHEAISREPTDELMEVATDELLRLAEEIQPVATRLVFLAGNRQMTRVVTKAGLALAEFKREGTPTAPARR